MRSAEALHGIAPDRIEAFRRSEASLYAERRPRSRSATNDGLPGFLGGVPMHWMRDWPMPFPFVVAGASGATLVDLDGNELHDFCLGDTGSMFGHAPPAVCEAIAAQGRKGFTTMLPGEDALVVGSLLRERFGLPDWQIAATASDANRFAIRLARAVTGRPKILVFHGCYHGAVDDSFVTFGPGGEAHNRPGLLGEFRDLSASARIAQFNDLDSVEAALRHGDVAVVLTEPVMTNSCMVLPEPGFHEGLRRLTREAGTLLLVDETHTISSGWGGYARSHGLEPDILVVGKPLAGGIPAAIWGVTEEVAGRYRGVDADRKPGHSGMGTTLSGSPLQLAAMRAMLDQVMTREAYGHMDGLAQHLEAGLSRVVAGAGLPWHVVRVGARVEFVCAPGPLRNGSEAAVAHAPDLEAAIHLGLLNRGSLIAPFHNMMLASPATTPQQVDRLVNGFEAVAGMLA